MKRLRHIVTVLLWTLIGVYAVLMLTLHLPVVQRATGGAVADALASKLGTRVEVGRVDLGFLNRLIVDDALVCDQRGKPMLQVARLSVKVDLLPLFNEGRVSISSAQLFGARLSLNQASATAKPNYQFALDSLASKDTTASKPFDVRVNSFILRHASISYDRLDVAPTHGKFNPCHLALSEVNANVLLRALTPDTLDAEVRRLSLREQSGLELGKLSFRLAAGRRAAQLSNLSLKVGGSSVAIPNLTARYRLSGDGRKMEPGSLSFAGAIHSPRLDAADFGWALPSLRKVDATVKVDASFRGTDARAELTKLFVDGLGGGLSLRGSGMVGRERGSVLWGGRIESLALTPAAAHTLASGLGRELPSVVERLGDVRLEGKAEGGGGRPLFAEALLSTGAGEADVVFSMGSDKAFKATLLAREVALATLLDDAQLGTLTAGLDLRGSLADAKHPTVTAKGSIDKLTYKGYDYTGVAVDGGYSPQGMEGTIAINDPNLVATLKGQAVRRGPLTELDLEAHVGDLAPQALRLSRKWGDARFSGTASAHGHGSSLASAVGMVAIDDLSMRGSEGDYALHRLTLKSETEQGRRFVSMQSDFGHAEIAGRFDHSTIVGSVLDALDRHLPSLRSAQPHRQVRANDFLVNAEISSTEWLEKLLRVPLHSEGRITFTGKVDDFHGQHYLNGSASSLDFAGQHVEDVRLALTSTEEAMHCSASLVKVMQGDRLSLGLVAQARADSLEARATWRNTARRHFSGQLEATAQVERGSAGSTVRMGIKPSTVRIDGKEWTVRPAHVNIAPRHIEVEGFSFRHADQFLTINGVASRQSTDTLAVDLNGIDVAYVLNLVNFHAVDFGGQASGRALLTAPFGTLGGSAALTVKDFTFEDGRMGTLRAKADWNAERRSIDLHATSTDGPASLTYIDGYITPSPGYIDLDIRAAGTPLDFMRSFTSAFLSDIGGNAHGAVRLHGPLKTINLSGQLVVDGHASVEATGTTYHMQGDTVRFVSDLITLDHAPYTDGHGGHGTLTGEIRHSHLSRIAYDLEAEATNTLVYDFKDFGSQTFYATVYGTGSVGIHGGGGRGLLMDVNLTPQRGSTFVYNVSDPDAVASQEFVRWNDGFAHHDTASVTPPGHAAPQETTSDTRIDFAINMTPDATIRLLMDSQTKDYITLAGSGALNASYYNKGAFNMYGTYNVTGGTYGVTIQNIIKKYFQFNDGGTITFRGDPYEADLNLQAVYTVNGVSLSDLNIGSSFASNTIRVNCLMNITGQPNSPAVDFDMDLPTVSADEKQLIRSVINSEDEMNQQVLYLLGIGRFYPQGANNSAAQNERQQDQTSLAMQSLLSGTLSSQLNSLLGTVIKSNNWNFGANISTGDEGWNNAEYEGLLSGRLLNNRLLFNGQFGYRDNAATANTTFIGDFDIRYLLQPNGNLALKVYNQTNDRYFTKSSLNTQGIGLIIKRDFNGLGDLFGGRKAKTAKAAKKKGMAK